MNALVPWIVGAVALLSMAALALALRGRKLTIPARCAHCGFDVESLVESGTHGKRCPECGSELDAPYALRRQRRQRHRGLIVFSALLLALSLVYVSPRVLAFFSTAAWMAQLPQPALSSLIRIANGPTLKQVAAEAQRRARVYADQHDTASLAQLARACLARQQDPSQPWEPLLGTVIERAYDHNAITDAEALTFTKGTFKVTLSFLRPSMPGAAYYKFGIIPDRCSDNATWGANAYSSTKLRSRYVSLHFEKVYLDGISQKETWPEWNAKHTDPDPIPLLYTITGGAYVTSSDMPVPVEDATREIRVVYTVTLGDTHWTEEFVGPLEIIATKPDVIEPTTDPKLAPAMQSLFTVQAFVDSKSPSWAKRVLVNIRFAGSGAPVCFRFTPEIEGSRVPDARPLGLYPWSISTDEFHGGARYSPFELPQVDATMPPDWDGKSITLVLKPSLDPKSSFREEISTVRDNNEKLRMWNAPVRFEDVPISQEPPVAGKPEPATPEIALTPTPIPALATLIQSAQGENLAGAAGEADSRASNLALSQPELTLLARAALARQASAEPWDTRLGALIERAYDAGAISTQEGEAYFLQGLELSVMPLEGITPGRASWKLTIARTRMGADSRGDSDSGYGSNLLRDLSVDLVLCNAAVNGTQVYPYPPGDPRCSWTTRLQANGGGILASTAISTIHTIDAPLLDGNATVTMDYDLVVGASSKSWSPATRVPLVASVPDIVEPVTDPEIDEKMRQAFSVKIRRFWARVGPDGSVPTEVIIEFFPTRVPMRARIGFLLNRDILNRTNTRWYTTESSDCIWANQGYSPDTRFHSLWATFQMDPTWTAKTTDITLIGRRDGLACFPTEVTDALNAGAKLPMWVGRFTIPNVPVEDLGRRPETGLVPK